MDEKQEAPRRERRKKSDSRGQSNDAQPPISDDARSASKVSERQASGEDRHRRDLNSEQQPSIRPSNSQRATRDEIPAARPSSSQRRSESELKERVVRDTVSFNRVDPTPTPARQSPIPIQPAVAAVQTKPKVAADPDDYDEDFEAYDDDFEADEEDSKPSSKPTPSSSVPKSTINSRADDEMKKLRQSMQQENSQALERMQNQSKREIEEEKNPSAVSPNSQQYSSASKSNQSSANSSQPSPITQPTPLAQAKKKKSSGLMGFSNVSNLTQGPRMKRLQQLRASGVLDLQEDKALVLNIIPSTPYEVYHRQIFSQSPQIRQVGVPFDTTKRDIDTMTEEIVMVDKEMQYVYGDDTSLIRAMNRVAFRKMAKKLNLTTGSKSSDEEMWNEPLVQSAGAGGGESGKGGAANGAMEEVNGNGSNEEIVNENRLNLFLQSAGQLFEDILNEENVRNEQKNQSRKNPSMAPQSFFTPSSDWISLGEDASEGSNELVRGRNVSAVCFSSLQPHLLLTAHPFNEHDENDLRPFKGIYCIWSLSAPGAPTVVLEGSGQPTCCSFSSTQTFIVVSGTTEGTIHMWDLRESNTLHANRDTIDLRIAKGLRKPCYSTQTLTVSNSLEYAAYAATLKISETSDVEWDQHSCPLVQIQSITSSASSSQALDTASMSHFVTLDSSGKAIIWVASQTSGTVSSAAADLGMDYGLSPWGKMRLVRQRVLYGATSHPSDAFDFGRDLLPRSQPVLGVIPGDTSTFLLSHDAGGHGGSVKKVARYDTSTKAGHHKSNESLQRLNQTHVVVNLNDRSDSKEDQPMGIFNPITLSSFTPPVSCIAVSPYSISLSNDSRNNSPLVLIGRTDGSVDIFYLENGEILTTWSDLSMYQSSSSSSSSSSRSSMPYDPSSSAIVYAAWVSWNSPSFMLIDSSGVLYYFDLFRDSSKPIFIEDLSISSSALLPNLISLSTCRSIGGIVHLAVGEVDHLVSQHGLKIKKVSDELIWSSYQSREKKREEGKESKEEKEERGEGERSSKRYDSNNSILNLSSQSSSWIGKVTGTNVILEYRGGSSSDGIVHERK